MSLHTEDPRDVARECADALLSLAMMADAAERDVCSVAPATSPLIRVIADRLAPAAEALQGYQPPAGKGGRADAE
jgi:hypothetical protein